MSHPAACMPRRRGFSYLETQVAMVLFMMTVSGVVPLFVLQTRQLARVAGRFEPATTQFLIQPEGRWAKKLGAPARLSDKPPEPSAIVSDPFPIITVDNGDDGYTEENKVWQDWYHYHWSRAYGSDFALNFPDAVGDRAIWEFKGLKPGKYDILVTYPHFSFANRDAEYEFFLNGQDAGDEKVDQRKPPGGPTVDGVSWRQLKTIKVKKKNSTIEVVLSDIDAKGYNVIDAMRLVPEEPKMFLHKLKAPLDEEYIEVLVHVEFSDNAKN